MAKGYYLSIDAKEISYNTNANTSNVAITVKGHSPVETAYGAWQYDTTTLYLTCNGVQRAISVNGYDFRNATVLTLATANFNDIQHNSDGTKSIDISASWYADNAYVQSSSGSYTLTASTSLALTNIPRSATLTGADHFNDEQNPTISYSNPARESVTSLQACISLTGASDDIPYRDIDINGNSYTFNLTDAERNILRNATTTANSREVIFFVKTVLNGTTYHSTLSRTLTIVNANPVLNAVTYNDSNTAVTDITNNNQVIVQNKSNLLVNYAAATFKKGASLNKFVFSLNGVNIESTSANGTVNYGKVDSATDLTLTASVVDSRGNVAIAQKKVTFVAYQNPRMSIDLHRLNNYEDTTYLTVNAEISSVPNNAVTIQYQYKLKGGTYGSLTNLSNYTTATLTLDKNSEYIFKVIITDRIGGSTSQELALNKGVFPLFIDTQKNSVGMNKFPSHEKSLEVEGDIYCNNLFSNNAVVLYDGISTAGTLENITLSDSVENYSYVEIFATKDTDSGIWSVKTPSPQGKTVNIGTQYYAPNTAVQIVCKTVVLDGNKLVQGTEYYINFAFYAGSMINIGDQKTVKVLMVVGYK